MLFKGPKSLLDSITNVIKEGREQYNKEQAEMNKLVAEKMLSPKQKKIAAVAGHPGKIDAADFAALRAGKQVKEASDTPDKPFKYNKKTGTFDRVKKMEEEVEPIDELSKETKKDFKARQERLAAASAQTAKDPARLARLSKIPGYTAAMDLAKKTTQKEEVEPIDELSKGTLGSYVRKAAKQAVGAANAAGREEMSTGKNSTEKRDLANRRMGGILRATRKMEEEVEGVEEAAKWRSSSAAEPNPKHQADVASFDRSATGGALRSKADTPTSQYSLMNRKKSKVATQGPRAGMITKKSAESLKNKIRMNAEETDTPGNGREHQCAIHVKHATMGEGKTLTTQHAEPDEYGNIAWYDVMFEHGIERVMTDDIEILVSEAHTHMKKKGVSAGTTAESRDVSTSQRQRQAHQHNLDAAQREIDRREAEGEDMTGAKIDPKNYQIIKPKKKAM